MSAVMAVTTTKVSPSGRYAWQIFERSGSATHERDEAIVVVCESMQTFPSIHTALLSGQRVLQSMFTGLDE